MNFDDTNQYNYFQYLITEDIDDEKVLNTLELFAFGSIQHYIDCPQHYLELSDSQVKNLIKLSIWDILSLHDGGQVDIHHIHQYVNKSIPMSEIEVERILLDMKQAVDLRIDEINQVVLVRRVLQYRDVFDPQLYKLRILQAKSLQEYGDQLEQWQVKIKQVHHEYNTDSSRKRRIESQ